MSKEFKLDTESWKKYSEARVIQIPNTSESGSIFYTPLFPGMEVQFTQRGVPCSDPSLYPDPEVQISVDSYGHLTAKSQIGNQSFSFGFQDENANSGILPGSMFNYIIFWSTQFAQTLIQCNLLIRTLEKEADRLLSKSSQAQLPSD